MRPSFLKMILMVSVFLFGIGSRCYLNVLVGTTSYPAPYAKAGAIVKMQLSAILKDYVSSKKRSRFDFDFKIVGTNAQFNVLIPPDVGHLSCNTNLRSRLTDPPKPRPC